MKASDVLICKYGTRLLTAKNTDISIKFSGFIPDEDTVLNSIYSGDVNVLNQITDDPNQSLMPIVNAAPEGKSFTKVNIKQGKITVILEPYTQEDFE